MFGSGGLGTIVRFVGERVHPLDFNLLENLLEQLRNGNQLGIINIVRWVGTIQPNQAL